jgi:hypothetical protein
MCFTEVTSLLQFTINVRKLYRRSQFSLQLVCEDRVLLVVGSLHLSLCGQQHPKCEPAIHLVYPPFICKRRSSSNPTNEILRLLVLEFQTGEGR